MGLLDFIFGKKKEARTSMLQPAAKPQTTSARQTTSASSTTKAAELSITPFVFESNQHQRYENGNPVKGLQKCPRTVKVEKNINGCSGYQLNNGDGYIVRMINGDTGQPQMSAKPMRVIKSTASEVTLRGYMVSAQTPFGFQDIDMSDYGLTVSLKDGKVVKCALHMYDRNVDIEYRKVALKPQQQDQMMYDIRNVGFEYMQAVSCAKNGDIEKAIKHYQSAIDNYEYADNEYILSSDSPYTITEYDGSTQSFPSVSHMVEESYRGIRKLRNKIK